ncbi:MAG: MBL fold metallo-hydrolase [Flavobacteriales bacterium]|jgi:L-ascorbate metabolism protein UlaG (beta-lactamase superfamily)|nr:MBL fold metallo-hydrolase [Flavobacteriales bacterium]
MKSIFKKMLITLFTIIGLFIIAYILVVNFVPDFGGDISEERKKRYQNSSQFKEGVFKNVIKAPKDLNFGETIQMAYYFFTTKTNNPRPNTDLEVQKLDSASVANYQGDARLFWYGHSSFLLQIQGLNIFLDPMLGEVPAPLPFLSGKRFNKYHPLDLEKIEQMDAVIISHDHYDHLDYKSILKIKEKVKMFFVPYGVGVHLEKWGIPSEKIKEMDWWEETNFKGLKLVCTPAQHFSGRKMNNRMSTLWSSWVIQNKEEKIFFSGDSGYGDHFKEIGEKYGPFDIALMECGQYDKKWADIHMMPEETALAGVDVRAKKMMPIHWAGFKLALHEWTDPIKRVKTKAKELNLPMISPEIGAEILVKDSTDHLKENHWWETI